MENSTYGMGIAITTSVSSKAVSFNTYSTLTVQPLPASAGQQLMASGMSDSSAEAMRHRSKGIAIFSGKASLGSFSVATPSFSHFALSNFGKS